MGFHINRNKGTSDGDPDPLEKQLNARYPWVGYLILPILAFIMFMIATCIGVSK